MSCIKRLSNKSYREICCTEIPESETIVIVREGQPKPARTDHPRHSMSCMLSSIVIDRSRTNQPEAHLLIQNIGNVSRVTVQHIGGQTCDLRRKNFRVSTSKFGNLWQEERPT